MASSRAQTTGAAELLAVFARLYAAYGPQAWWPSQSAFETIVGAILTQNTAWSNVERAIDRLRRADALSALALTQLDTDTLALLIRPSGYYRAKAVKLKAFCRMVDRDFDGRLEDLLALPLDELRTRLLATYGIGPETADAIVLYAAERPSFVVDAYTRRIFGRLGMAPEARGYDHWRRFLMSQLPNEPALFNEYHALLVRHAKQSCRTRPACADCVLHSLCPTAADIRAGDEARLAASPASAIP